VTTVEGVRTSIVAHAGQTGLHDVVLLGSFVIGPAVLLAVVFVVGKLRGDDDED